jgi:hypothetical protein
MQLSVSQTMAAGRVGGIADSSLKDVETHKNPDAEIKFGCVVTKGAATGEVVHPDAAAEITDEKLVRGVALASHEMESVRDDEAPGYVVESVIPVMRKGRVWVLAEDTISEGTSTVNVRYASGAGGTQLGGLRGAAVSMETAVLPKSKWKSSTSGNGQLAILELDL